MSQERRYDSICDRDLGVTQLLKITYLDKVSRGFNYVTINVHACTYVALCALTRVMDVFKT